MIRTAQTYRFFNFWFIWLTTQNLYVRKLKVVFAIIQFCAWFFAWNQKKTKKNSCNKFCGRIWYGLQQLWHGRFQQISIRFLVQRYYDGGNLITGRLPFFSFLLRVMCQFIHSFSRLTNRHHALLHSHTHIHTQYFRQFHWISQ